VDRRLFDLRLGSALAGLGLLFGTSALAAQNADREELATVDPAIVAEDYIEPPAHIAAAVLAPRWEDVSLGNGDVTNTWFLQTVSDGPPSLASYAKPHLNLGAWRIDPAAKRNRNLTTRNAVGYRLVHRDGQRTIDLEVPNGARVSGASWSPDGSQVAFFAHYDDGSHIHVADVEDGDSRQITREHVLATNVTNIQWSQDGSEIFTFLPPENWGPAPEKPPVPETPMVRLTTETENRLRTYFDLLEDPWEIETIKHFSTGQVAAIDVDSRRVTRIGPEVMATSIDPAPDGQLLRVTQMVPPFSYIVPATSVGSKTELWDRDGNVIEVLDERDLRESAVDDGDDDDEEEDDAPEKRGLTWRTDGGEGMMFLRRDPAPEGEEDEETEEQEEEQEARMDRLYFWLPPYSDDSIEEVYASERQMQSVAFDAEGGMLFITRRQGNGQNGTVRIHAVDLSAPDEEYLVYEREGDVEITEEPGSLAYMPGPNGGRVVRTTADGSSVFLTGTQYFEDPNVDAPRPFADRVDIRTGETERIWQSSADLYETIETVLDRDMTEMIVERQSPTMQPNQYYVNLATGEDRQVTFNPDHTPEITALRRERFMVTRPDGFESLVEVTMPAGWEPGDPAPPAMFWFYPREYEDQDDYDEGFERFNRNDYPNVGTRSMQIMALQGYAVVEPDLPIVGGDTPNDNYVQDLRNTLSTVIDSLDERGLADRAKLGIGGHSYGAFGTANAMVNTPFFKAGIAGDGNYNRTLTPAAFQRESRYLWEAEQVYLEMSPFLTADRMTGALLMYHGMDDHNVGTHPDHARRMFHALNVLGKTASLYMYPYEDHGPATRETLLDLWARWTVWLDTYVKGEETRLTMEEELEQGMR
jgi:dipeptidyl aminopeptidase/acylaminoacyl peptidase